MSCVDYLACFIHRWSRRYTSSTILSSLLCTRAHRPHHDVNMCTHCLKKDTEEALKKNAHTQFGKYTLKKTKRLHAERRKIRTKKDALLLRGERDENEKMKITSLNKVAINIEPTSNPSTLFPAQKKKKHTKRGPRVS